MENSNLEHTFAHGTQLAISLPIISFKDKSVLDDKVAMVVDCTNGNAKFLNTDVITFTVEGIESLISQNIPFMVFSNLLGVEPEGSSSLNCVIEWREAGESLGTHIVNGVEMPIINDRTGGTEYSVSHWAIVWDSQQLDLSDGLLDAIQETLTAVNVQMMQALATEKLRKASSASAKRRERKAQLAQRKLTAAEPKVEPTKGKAKGKGKAADENPLG